MRNPVRRLQQSFKPEMGYGGHSPWSSGGGDARDGTLLLPRVSFLLVAHSACICNSLKCFPLGIKLAFLQTESRTHRIPMRDRNQ